MTRCVCLLAGTAESSQPRPLKKHRWHGLSMPTVPHSAPLAGTANSADMTFIGKPGRAELSMRHVLFAPCLYHTIWYYVTAECDSKVGRFALNHKVGRFVSFFQGGSFLSINKVRLSVFKGRSFFFFFLRWVVSF